VDDRLYFLLALLAATVAFWLVGSPERPAVLDPLLRGANVLAVAVVVLAALLFAAGFLTARREA